MISHKQQKKIQASALTPSWMPRKERKVWKQGFRLSQLLALADLKTLRNSKNHLTVSRSKVTLSQLQLKKRRKKSKPVVTHRTKNRKMIVELRRRRRPTSLNYLCQRTSQKRRAKIRMRDLRLMKQSQRLSQQKKSSPMLTMIKKSLRLRHSPKKIVTVQIVSLSRLKQLKVISRRKLRRVTEVYSI